MKKITVITNDESNLKMPLTVAGKVIKFVKIVPKRVTLLGKVGEKIIREVEILPLKKYPFKIVDVSTMKKKDIKVKYQIKDPAKPVYQLIIENLKKDAGRYHDTIFIKTDSAVKPVIKLHVRGTIRESKE